MRKMKTLDCFDMSKRRKKMPPGRGNHRRESRKAVRYGLNASCYILDEFAPGHVWNHDETERLAIVATDNVTAVLDLRPEAVASLTDGEQEYRE